MTRQDFPQYSTFSYMVGSLQGRAGMLTRGAAAPRVSMGQISF